VSDYPEHDKLQAISDRSQAIGEFLEWLQDKGVFLAQDFKWEDEEPTMASLGLEPEHPRYRTIKIKRGAIVPWPHNKTKTLAEFFGINLVLIEDEKRAMLDEIRTMQEKTHG